MTKVHTDGNLMCVSFACRCRLIAGTYTPLCMLALDRATATRLLCIEWGAAFLGMVRPCCICAEPAI
jgi:channel protein (hemolysin III family)